jgi:hypothetical protein
MPAVTREGPAFRSRLAAMMASAFSPDAIQIEYRKRKLGKLLRAPHLGIVLNEHYDGDGNIIFKHACKLGCEGIVSKRLSSMYRSGRSPHWVKVKNPKAPALGERPKRIGVAECSNPQSANRHTPCRYPYGIACWVRSW